MLTEQVDVALDVDDLAVVKESVEDSGGDHGIPEDRCKSVKLLFEVTMVELRS